MGRQTYDMTRILMVDHSAGRSIFLAEVDTLWPSFMETMVLHLPDVMPEAAWSARLEADPESSIRIYSRS